MNVRFQPYRLEDSKCWRNSNGDSRLACIACHNPHEQLNQDASSYDAKCLVCHSAGLTTNNSAANSVEKAAPMPRDNSHETSTPKICPQSKSNCITCHMPQVEVPTVHAAFFDHRIRIVRANSSNPM
jgi:nitrate reductase cytochrome c-type subunit